MFKGTQADLYPLYGVCEFDWIRLRKQSMALRFYKLEADCTIGAPDVSGISPVVVDPAIL
jgi:hypothetical protein